jgi:acetate kinase
LDTIVFTGGIGTHAAAVRAELCLGLEHLSVILDLCKAADAQSSARTAPRSPSALSKLTKTS